MGILTQSNIPHNFSKEDLAAINLISPIAQEQMMNLKIELGKQLKLDYNMRNVSMGLASNKLAKTLRNNFHIIKENSHDQ